MPKPPPLSGIGTSGCFFEFNRSQSITGNFSSPNYPGLYPIDIICEYRFSGLNVRRIDIAFLEFDVESMVDFNRMEVIFLFRFPL
ncbi:unnamed protein product [Schistosoma mattheei]|uniref:Uncharacterized protein n=1 Tax=Schistosoma mattheei TaxID=31246 RepID=A0A183NL99_9TREM|nr:unnamed protein product [Schistosoma mattheei]